MQNKFRVVVLYNFYGLVSIVYIVCLPSFYFKQVKKNKRIERWSHTCKDISKRATLLVILLYNLSDSSCMGHTCISKVRYVLVLFCSEGSTRQTQSRILKQRNHVCRCCCPPVPRKRLRVRAEATGIWRQWLAPQTQPDRLKFGNPRRTRLGNPTCSGQSPTSVY